MHGMNCLAFCPGAFVGIMTGWMYLAYSSNGGNLIVWTSFLLGATAGLAATPHCLAMCGGFPLHLARSPRMFARQALFVAGKAFTYVFLGTLAASAGAVVFRDTRFAVLAPAMRLAVGVLTLALGLVMLGIRFPSFKAPHSTCDTGLVRSVFTGLLAGPGLMPAFVLGLAAGFLPCPLPMAMLAMSAASRDIATGMALMAGVGLGTAPGLIALGLFGIGLNKTFARVGVRAAGIVVVAIALLTIGRATGIVHANSPIDRAIPPCCQGHVR